MNRLFFLLGFAWISLSFVQCKKETHTDSGPPTTSEATVLGRWQAEGFEETIRYEFTADKRYTIYGDGSGDFPTLQEFQDANPQLTGNDWYYSGDTVVVDLHFGNYSRLLPLFSCDNEVINWQNPDGSMHSTYYREGHSLEDCR